MDNDSVPISASQKRLSSFWPWLMVLLVLLLVGLVRFRLLEMPLERDEGEYAYAGQLILQGIPPYQQAYNMKLPGTYLAYALGMDVFGQTTDGIHLMLMTANSLTIVFVFLFGRKLFGAAAGLAACASYGILSVSPAVLGMAAHANHFVNLFSVPATMLLWQSTGSNRRATLFFSGVLYGLAFLMKQPAMFICLFGWLFLVWHQMRGKFSWRISSVNFFAFGFGMILPYALICLWLKQAGVFSQFWFWTFDYARSYINEISFQDGMWFLGMYLGSVFDVYAGFLAMIIVGLVLALRIKALQDKTTFVLGFCACSFLATAVGFHFWRNYFILLLPAFSILVGMAAGLLQQVLQTKTTKTTALAFPASLFMMVFIWNIVGQREVFFYKSADQICQEIYPDQPFIESLAVARYIREHSSENARVAVLGSEPQIYFYARRRSATGYIYTYALTEDQPYADKMQRQMMDEIAAVHPEFLVRVYYEYSWGPQLSTHPEIFRWLDEYSEKFYRPVGVVGIRPSGEIVSFLGDEGKMHTGSLRHSIVIYQRKPSSETAAPIKN